MKYSYQFLFVQCHGKISSRTQPIASLSILINAMHQEFVLKEKYIHEKGKPTKFSFRIVDNGLHASMVHST